MGEHTTEFDQIAEWLGDMPEAYNVTDYTDEQTTVITIDVDALARRVGERIAARQAEALGSAKADIKARITTFRDLGANDEYLNALNDAWGLVANRERAVTPPAPQHFEDCKKFPTGWLCNPACEVVVPPAGTEADQ